MNMDLATIFEFVMALFENEDVLEIVKMVMDIVGPLVGGLLK